MIKKLKKVKLFLYICLGLIILNACTFEEEIIKQNGYQERMKLESKKFSELLKLPAFSNAYKRVINKKVALSNDLAARTALEDQYGFTIVEGKDVKIITDVDGSVYYNMLIERTIKENLKFENLVIKVKDGDVGAVILKYELNEKATFVENHDTYAIDVKESSIQVIEVEGKMMFIPINCWNVVTITCNNTTAGEAPNHIAHSGCFAAALNDNNAHITYNVTEYCFGINIDMSGGGGTPVGTGTGSEGGGPGGGNYSNGSSNNGSNQNGETPLTNNTPPIKNVIIPSDEVVEANEDQCEKLNNLLKRNGTIPNPYRAALLANKASVNVTQNPKEKGQRIKISPVTLQPSVEEINNPSNDCNEIPINVTNFMFGFFHSHPVNCGTNGINPLFSAQDIYLFCQIVANHNGGGSTYQNGTPVDVNNFIITVAGEYGTFALKVNDRNAFVNTFLGLDAKETNDLIDDFNDAMASDDFNSLGQETHTYDKKVIKLLQLIQSKFGNSLSLYKADSDLTKWEKLERDGNSAIPKKIPCPEI